MSTYVLIHGAWHGGWAWENVKRLLEGQNHKVFAPTMIGLGERNHQLSTDITMQLLVDDIANLLVSEDLQEVILVGHSFGGAVISAVAEREPQRIRQLIYLDAAILEDGESMLSCMPKELAEQRRQQAKDTSEGLSLPIPNAEQLGILNKDQWDHIQSRLTPHPISTYDSAICLKDKPGHGFHCTYVTCLEPIYLPLEWARKRVEKYAWPVRLLQTGHDAMVSDPLLLTEKLIQWRI